MKPRSAFVTGGTGFVGGYLVRALRREGWAVHCLVRDRQRLGQLASVAGEVALHGPGGSVEGLEAALAAAQPDVVFHLASCFLAEHAPGQIDELIESNLGLPTRLAEAMSRHGLRRLVNTGTAWQHFQSGQAYHPVNLYAATKQAAEDLLAYYVSARGFHVVTLKLFDTYGPEDPRAKLPALLRRAACSGETLQLSPGAQRVDYVHIEDVARAFLLAAERTGRSGPGQEQYAVSSGQPISLREFVEAAEQAAGRPLAVAWGARPYRQREVMEPWLGGPVLPGWSPRISLAEGLKQWFAAPDPSCA